MQFSHRPENLTLTVDADLKLSEIQDILHEHQQFLPIGPFSNDYSIREIIDQNLLSPWSDHFGQIKNWVLNMTVNMNGSIIKTGSDVMKNVAGYNLNSLLIGARGQLGEILSITFKVLPQNYSIDVDGNPIQNGLRIIALPHLISSIESRLDAHQIDFFTFHKLAVIDISTPDFPEDMDMTDIITYPLVNGRIEDSGNSSELKQQLITMLGTHEAV